MYLSISSKGGLGIKTLSHIVYAQTYPTQRLYHSTTTLKWFWDVQIYEFTSLENDKTDHLDLYKSKDKIVSILGTPPLCLQTSYPFLSKTINVGTIDVWYFCRIYLPKDELTLILMTRKFFRSDSNLSTSDLALRHATQKFE